MPQVTVGEVRGVLVLVPGADLVDVNAIHERVEKWLRDGGSLVFNPGDGGTVIVNMSPRPPEGDTIRA